MEISLIVATDKNNAIGKDGKMPWHLSKDLKYFKQKTLNNPVIMGRKTFDSIGFALANRLNIVVTTNKNWNNKDVIVVNDISSSLDFAKKNIKHEDDEIFVIGGGTIYKQFLPYATKIYKTDINLKTKDSTVFFPDFLNNGDNWQIVEKSENFIENDIEFCFKVYKKYKKESDL